METHTGDIEKNLSTAETQPAINGTPSPGFSSVKRLCGTDGAQTFRRLVGLEDDPSMPKLETHLLSEKQAEKHKASIYLRARDYKRRRQSKYIITNWITNIMYLVQIVLAATFTALSTYAERYSVVLTVLGALNTVLAGCLAWLKGQGVPQRYREARKLYEDLVLDIENTARCFSVEGNTLDVWDQFNRIKSLFENATKDEEANHPDIFVTSRSTSGRDPGQMQVIAPGRPERNEK